MSDEVVTPPAQDTPKAGGDKPGETTPPPAADQKVQKQAEGDAKPADSGKQAEETKAPAEQAPVVPDKYDLKLPEGSALDAAHVEKVASYAKEQGLSNEQAQALLDRENKAVASYVDSQVEQLKKQGEVWVESIRSDKELGGEGFKQNVELAKRVMHRFGSEQLRNTLTDTGLGNHPELVRVFARIGKAMGDDQLVIPGAQAGGPRTMESILYGKSE